MVDLLEVVEYIDSQFRTRHYESYKEESGITYHANKDIKKVGYATNLTPEVIEQAKEQEVDLILTHHDAWEFIYGLKETCDRLLKEYDISHYYNHLPLDDSDFGTNSSLAKELGLVEIKKAFDEDGYSCGVITEFNHGKTFNEFVQTVEETLGEKVQSWKFNDKEIKRIGILCGAGHITTDMKEAIEEKCDLYLTGEKILYTVEYAKLHNLNLVVGSHTYIELFGVKSMAKLVENQFDDIKAVLLAEEHIEANGF